VWKGEIGESDARHSLTSVALPASKKPPDQRDLPLYPTSPLPPSHQGSFRSVWVNGAIEDPATILAAKAKLSPEQLAGPPASLTQDLASSSASLTEKPRLVWLHSSQQLIYQVKSAAEDGSGATTRLLSADIGAALGKFDESQVRRYRSQPPPPPSLFADRILAPDAVECVGKRRPLAMSIAGARAARAAMRWRDPHLRALCMRATMRTALGTMAP
jgi:hypothetical protein